MKEDDEGSQDAFESKEGDHVAFKPDENKYVPVNDLRETWKQDSQKWPTTREQRLAFYQRRIELIQSTDISDDHKSELLEDLKGSVKQEESAPAEPPDPEPIPGGVGYGAFYKDGALGFTDSTVLHYSIVTIPNIGNVRNEWLYLTSTNRSPKGVEAFISYHEQENPVFTVFDWSKTGEARWALSRPYSLLGDYFSIHPVGVADEYQTIYVVNGTRRLAGNRWRNEVMLYNENSHAYDLVYSNEYDLNPADEQKYLSWGPIVETFPPFPFGTNDIGFFDAQLIQDGGAAKSLTEDVTNLRIDFAGFKIVLKSPNYSFIVHWEN